MFSFTRVDFGPGSDLPHDGLRSLFGPCPHAHIRDKLTFLFGVSPSFETIDLSAHYEEFCRSLSDCVSDTTCECSNGCGSHSWANLSSNGDPCLLRSILAGFQCLVGDAILMCFVDTDLEILSIVQHPKGSLGPHICRSLLRRVSSQINIALDFKKPSVMSDSYTTQQLHADLCQLLGYIPSNAGEGQNVLGSCNGSTSIFPMTLGADSSIKRHLVRYRVLDGQFHDGHNYYKAITENLCVKPRALARVSIQQNNDIISPSAMGAHSDTVFTVRPYHNSLTLRALVNFGTKIEEMSLYDANLAYMATFLARPCDHHPKDPVTLLDTTAVVRTGVEAPVASDNRISMVLTHDHGEAQFLAGVRGVPSIYQGISCLGCMINTAQEGGFQLLIQS